MVRVKGLTRGRAFVAFQHFLLERRGVSQHSRKFSPK